MCERDREKKREGVCVSASMGRRLHPPKWNIKNGFGTHVYTNGDQWDGVWVRGCVCVCVCVCRCVCVRARERERERERESVRERERERGGTNPCQSQPASQQTPPSPPAGSPQPGCRTFESLFQVFDFGI